MKNQSLLLKCGMAAKSAAKAAVPVCFALAALGLVSCFYPQPAPQASSDGPIDGREDGLFLEDGEKYPLLDAAHKCDAERLQKLLKVAAFEKNINEREAGTGTSALMYAAGSPEGCAEGAAILLEAGADPNIKNSEGRTALMHAARNGQTAVIERLLESGAAAGEADNKGRAALMFAAAEGHSEAAALLLKAGAAAGRGDKNGATALMRAAESGAAHIVSLLLEAGAAPDAVNRRGMTALMFAAKEGSADSFKKLLAAGADPARKTNRGRTALMHAARRGRHNIIEELLKIEEVKDLAHVNHQTERRGRTALMHAARGGHIQIVSLLLEAGADAALKDNDKTTALMFASMECRPQAVEKLLKIPAAKAGINELDSGGKTAFLLADEALKEEAAAGRERSDCRQALELLQAAGADIELGRGAFLNIKKALRKIFGSKRLKAEELRATASEEKNGGAAEETEEAEEGKKSLFRKAADFFKKWL